MAEDKIKKDKKTKEISENIYALNLDFDDETKEEQDIYKMPILEESEDLEENEAKIIDEEIITEEIEEPKKKKSLSKIEEGIKSSKRGRGRPKKTDKIQEVKTKKEKKNAANKLSAIKMHTEDNITEIKCSII